MTKRTGKPTRNVVQQRILKAHGLKKASGGGLQPRKLSDHRRGLTTVQRLLESRYGQDIEDIIGPERGSIYEVAEYLENVIAPSTIARWRVKLGIEYE